MPEPAPGRLQQFQAEDCQQWRNWLAQNHASSPGVRLVFYKKESGKSGVSYEEAVEEAVAFGWIDSRASKLDDQRYMVQFSPRRPKSIWARSNKLRAEKLIKEGRMTPAGLKVIETSQKDGSWNLLDDVDDLIIPPDLQRALAGNKIAGTHFQALSDSLKKQILWWIKSAKAAETRQKRITHVIVSAERNESPF